MVGLMGTRSFRGSAALTSAAGLLLLALLTVVCAAAWGGGAQGQRYGAAAIIPAGAELSAMSTVPQPSVRGPDHLPRLGFAGHRVVPVAERPGLFWPAAGSAVIRDPQQSGHRAVGSRSPPTA